MSEPVSIRSGALEAVIDPLGAELISLKDSEGREYMSDGDPAFWTGRAPLLFPIVGALEGDTYRLGEAEYAMEKHGFARRNSFDLVTSTEDSALFRLFDTAQTRAIYPFAFELDMLFHLDGTKLRMSATVRNTGDTEIPFSFGYHPAFVWPLPGGGEKTAHRIIFDKPEPAEIRRLNASGQINCSEAGPVEGNCFALHSDLFVDDAMIWDELASSALSYQSPDGPALDIEFRGLPYLGIWQKPGASFICIEPWAGLADDEGFAGDFTQKRGVQVLPRGGHAHFEMDVTLRRS